MARSRLTDIWQYFLIHSVNFQCRLTSFDLRSMHWFSFIYLVGPNVMCKKTTIAISDDHPHILNSLQQTFSSLPDFEVTHESKYGNELLKRLTDDPTDIAVTDFAVSNNDSALDGFEKIKQIHEQAPGVKLILLTSQRNSAILNKALDYGVSAIVSKVDDIEEIVAACRHLVEGEANYLSPTIRALRDANRVDGNKRAILTPKEMEVVRLFSSGFSLSKIAERQNRTISTISTQKYNAMRRLGISSNTELIRYAYSQGLI